MLGPVNSPHVEHLAQAISERGHEVHAAGVAWPELGPCSLPAAGIPTMELERPWPLWLRRTFRRVRPDVVHAHFLPFAGAAALVRARPLMATAWGSDVYRPTRAMAIGNRLAVRFADVVTTDSLPLLERLIDLGARRERAVLQNWGVDLTRFSPVAPDEQAALKRAFGFAPGPVILSSRGLGDVYSPQTVLDAFAIVAQERPDVQLVVKHAAATHPDLGRLPHADRIHFVGRIEYDRMPDLYRAADVCVSIPVSDSSPRSVWEAMACGTACVISDLPWGHDLIEPGTQAEVVPVEPVRVAAALSRLVGEPETAAAVRSAGRALVAAHRDERAELDRLEALYRRLAASSTAASSPASAVRE